MPMSPRLLRPRAASGDSDVLRYVAAVEAADGQALEQSVKDAIRDFILGCKTDNTWSAIKASCILMGARTLSGALTPLVGAAPTNNNFVGGDYSRKTGLVGNGTSKYLATGRNLAASDSQNNHHAAVFATELPSEGTNNNTDFGPLLAARASNTAAGGVQILNNGTLAATPNVIQVLSTNPNDLVGVSRTFNALAGLSRSASSGFVGRGGNSSSTFASNSQSLANADWLVFARTVGTIYEKYSKARLAFYSIGESLDLALLDSRVSTLYNAIGAAI